MIKLVGHTVGQKDIVVSENDGSFNVLTVPGRDFPRSVPDIKV
jgi:hypothetical protein